MKKLLLTATCFLCFTSYSQIKNLSDLLELSELSVEGLTLNLQGIWDLEVPTENYSADRNTITGSYVYKYSDGLNKQTLRRVIKVSNNMNYKSERTDFISNDKDLLNRIKKNLPFKGFELKQNKPHYIVYHDGKSMIGIIDNSTKEQKLMPGYYMISIFLH